MDTMPVVAHTLSVHQVHTSFFYIVFSSCLFPCLPAHWPCVGIFSLFFVLFLSVKHPLLYSCCFARAAGRCLFHFSAYGVPLAIAAFLLRSALLASSHPSEHLSFVSIWYFFFFHVFPFPLSSWSGLFCCGLVPGTLALHLLHLEELLTVWLTLFHSQPSVTTEFVSL